MEIAPWECLYSPGMSCSRLHAFMKNCSFPARLLACLLLLPGLALAQEPSQQADQTSPAPSVIEVPIRISLDRLFEVTESQVPLQSGSWPNWTRSSGTLARFLAWRGPLSITVQGDELLIQAHVRYILQARKKLMGMSMQSSCGIDERPRQAIIGVRVRLEIGPDWSVWPQFLVMPTRFLDACEMTFANIDVTPMVAEEFQRQLSGQLRSAFAMLAPEVQKVRSQAEQNWLLLQQPVKLWKDHWLLLNPQGAALSPMYGQGNWIDVRLALLMSPQVVKGEKPEPRYTQLPTLMEYYPSPTGMKLQLAVDMRYDSLARTMTEELAREPFEIKGHNATIEAITLSGEGQHVNVSVDLGGELAGSVAIGANLAFKPETQKFELNELQYQASLKDALLEADMRLFSNQIRRLLENSANRQLQDQVQEWRERLLATFERIIPDGMRLDATALRFQDIQVNMQPDSIQLDGLATGYISLLPE